MSKLVRGRKPRYGKNRVGDDLDETIYHLRIREHMTWRDIAKECNMNHEAARTRFHKLLQRVTPADIELMRTIENDRLDELATQHKKTAEIAYAAGDLKSLVKTLHQIHDITKTRIKLNGLEQPVQQEIKLTIQELDADLDATINAFLAGTNTQPIT